MSEIKRENTTLPNASLVIGIGKDGRVNEFKNIKYDASIYTAAAKYKGKLALNYEDSKSQFHKYEDNPTKLNELDICNQIKSDIDKAEAIVITTNNFSKQWVRTLYSNNNGDNRDNTLNVGKDVANQLVDKSIQLAKESGNIVAVSESPLVIVMDKGQAEQKAKAPFKEIANNIVRTLTAGKVEEMFK